MKQKISLEILETKTRSWAEDRGIIANSSSMAQFTKLVSEMGELADNIAKKRDVKDDIGDMLVVLTIIARLEYTNLSQCFNVAYNDIKDRKGYLNKDGIFVKEGDVE